MPAARSDAETPHPPLRHERDFAAPRALVWRMFAEAEHLAQWWGANGITNRVLECRLVTDGRLRIDMCTPDGTVHAMDARVVEARAPERLVLSGSLPDPAGGMLFEVRHTLTFAATAGGTRLSMLTEVVSSRPGAEPYLAGMAKGWDESFERLFDHAMTEGGGDREIVLSRVLAAPRELVWRVWTDPQHLAEWWGPRGFRTTTKAMAVAPGKDWRYVMHGPDGRDYENRIHYLEVEAPARLRYKHGGDVDCEPVNFEVEVTFVSEPDGRTRVTMRSRFATREARDLVITKYGALEGGKQTLARLGEHLAAEQATRAASASKPFRIERVFRVPRDRMFDVWTQQEHLAQWFGPQGCTLPFTRLDLRPGGTFLYCMRSAAATCGGADGRPADMWGKWVFVTIDRPNRLVFKTSFADEHGNTTRAPFLDKWPVEMLTTVTFHDHAGIGRGTLVVVEVRGAEDDAEAQRVFDAHHDSMRGGWTGTFAKLDELLARSEAAEASS